MRDPSEFAQRRNFNAIARAGEPESDAYPVPEGQVIMPLCPDCGERMVLKGRLKWATTIAWDPTHVFECPNGHPNLGGRAADDTDGWR